MVSTFILSNLLLASAALAAPSSQQEARLARRQENRQSQPVNSVASFARAVQEHNWNSHSAGMVVSNTNNHTLTSINGTFTVPTIVGDINGTTSFSMWVAMDGYACPCALRGGIEGNFTDGVVSYGAWYGFQPGILEYIQIPDYLIRADDVIKINIKANFSSHDWDEYEVVIENETTGQPAVHRPVVSTPSLDYHLCGQEAQWVAGISRANEKLPLADFGTVIFTNATATGPSDDYNLLDATAKLEIIQIQDGDKMLLTYVNATKDVLLVQYLSGH